MILVMVLPERLVLLDTIVLLTVPAANVRLVQKTKLKIPVPVLLVRQQKAAPTAAQATQLPQAAARAYVQSASHTPTAIPARADIQHTPARQVIVYSALQIKPAPAAQQLLLLVTPAYLPLLTRIAIPVQADIDLPPAHQVIP